MFQASFLITQMQDRVGKLRDENVRLQHNMNWTRRVQFTNRTPIHLKSAYSLQSNIALFSVVRYLSSVLHVIILVRRSFEWCWFCWWMSHISQKSRLNGECRLENSCQELFILSRPSQMDEKLHRNPLQRPNDCLAAFVCASAWEMGALENTHTHVRLGRVRLCVIARWNALQKGCVTCTNPYSICI